jgi:glycosyltransferase involved in cell wall biosynthesis
MFLSSKTILVISPEPWSYIFVSKHHYAIKLAERGNSVYFLNAPSADLKEDVVIEETRYKGVYVIDYTAPFKGLRFLPAFLRNEIEKRFIKKLERKINKTFDIIWNFENSRFYDFRFASKEVVKIYHQVDLDQNFHPSTATKTADIVFAVNDVIKGHLESFAPAIKIPHAFSGNFTEQARKVLNGDPLQIKKHERVQVYYVGNLESTYLDHRLLQQLVIEHPEVDFNLVGPYGESEVVEKLTEYKHVQLLGKHRPEQVMKFLDDADILLLLYAVDLFPDQRTSSHKVMEYLASGKAIVSTFLGEFVDKRDLLYMAEKSEDLPRLFNFCVTHMDEINDAGKMKKRIQFAMDNTYEARIQQIEKLLYQTVTSENRQKGN